MASLADITASVLAGYPSQRAFKDATGIRQKALERLLHGERTSTRTLDLLIRAAPDRKAEIKAAAEKVPVYSHHLGDKTLAAALASHDGTELHGKIPEAVLDNPPNRSAHQQPAPNQGGDVFPPLTPREVQLIGIYRQFDDAGQRSILTHVTQSWIDAQPKPGKARGRTASPR